MPEFDCITLKDAIQIVHEELELVIKDVDDAVIDEEEAFKRIEGLTLGMKIPDAEEHQRHYNERMRAIIDEDLWRDPGEAV